jgi:hypothetical protein
MGRPDIDGAAGPGARRGARPAGRACDGPPDRDLEALRRGSGRRRQAGPRRSSGRLSPRIATAVPIGAHRGRRGLRDHRAALRVRRYRRGDHGRPVRRRSDGQPRTRGKDRRDPHDPTARGAHARAARRGPEVLRGRSLPHRPRAAPGEAPGKGVLAQPEGRGDPGRGRGGGTARHRVGLGRRERRERVPDPENGAASHPADAPEVRT